MTDRPELLANIAEDIRQLTEPRFEATRYDSSEVTKSGGQKLVRRTYTVQLPSLLEALSQAIHPGDDGEAMMAGSFESQPSADLGAIKAEATIRRQVHEWSSELEVKPAVSLRFTLPKLVSAYMSDAQLERLAKAVAYWVKSARIATGFESEPVTISEPCPICGGKNKLTAFQDMTYVKCGRCANEWPEQMIGILSQQLAASTNHETMTSAERCHDSRCYRHTHPDPDTCPDAWKLHVDMAECPMCVHRDDRGRWWKTA